MPVIGPEARERRWSRSNRRWLSGASTRDSFSFDSALRGRGNDRAEPGEGVDASRRRSSGLRHTALEALWRRMESVAAAAC
jgi:hypothetical protein